MLWHVAERFRHLIYLIKKCMYFHTDNMTCLSSFNLHFPSMSKLALRVSGNRMAYNLLPPQLFICNFLFFSTLLESVYQGPYPCSDLKCSLKFKDTAGDITLDSSKNPPFLGVIFLVRLKMEICCGKYPKSALSGPVLLWFFNFSLEATYHLIPLSHSFKFIGIITSKKFKWYIAIWSVIYPSIFCKPLNSFIFSKIMFSYRFLSTSVNIEVRKT